MKPIKTPAGVELDVEAIASAEPSDALLLLSEKAQEQVGRLDEDAQTELGGLIVTLADVVAKLGVVPRARINITEGGGGLVSIAQVDGEDVWVGRVRCPAAAAVGGVEGLWTEACRRSPEYEITTTLNYRYRIDILRRSMKAHLIQLGVEGS